MTAVATAATREAAHERDDYALIRAAQQGDGRAFEELVRRYDQSVLRLAYRLLRSAEDASDVYQESFLRVHRNLHRFRFDCAFATWLHRIVTNLCLDGLRKRRTRREEPPVIATPGGPHDRLDAAPDGRADGDPQRRLWSSEVRARLDAALAALTPRERLVFELRHYEGLRLRAIGDALGTTEEAAKNCLFRATQKLRAALGDCQ